MSSWPRLVWISRNVCRVATWCCTCSLLALRSIPWGSGIGYYRVRSCPLYIRVITDVMLGCWSQSFFLLWDLRLSLPCGIWAHTQLEVTWFITRSSEKNYFDMTRLVSKPKTNWDTDIRIARYLATARECTETSSEFLVTDPEVSGSITGATRFSEK
jgi:hypothetical protein